MPVKLEEKYSLGGHELVDFKIDEKREFVRGKAGPYEVIVDKHGDIFILGKSEETKRRWIASYLPGGLWFSVAEEKEKEGLACQVHMIDGKPHFPKYLVVDEKLLTKTTGKKELGPFLTFDGVKNALKLYEKRKLRLAEPGKDVVAEKRLETLKGIVKYETEIREAAQLFSEVERIKEHPEVLKLAKGEGLIGEKPIMTEEKAQVLTAIDSIAKSGERVTALAILEWLQKKCGVEPGDSELGDIIKMGMLLGEVGGDGYVESTNKGRVLTDFGRKELEEYSKKKNTYVA